MATFILATKMSKAIRENPSMREKIGKQWLARVKEKCPKVKWIAHYALLGPYDFIDIYEAPNEEAAAQVSMISLANGASVAESWSAIPYHRFLELIQDL